MHAISPPILKRIRFPKTTTEEWGMATSLAEILELVGSLDDAPGTDTARERFRAYLKTKIRSVSDLREYVEACFRESGDQYNRALQDLVNRLGELLGFEVDMADTEGCSMKLGTTTRSATRRPQKKSC
jgi:hypothetical protein